MATSGNITTNVSFGHVRLSWSRTSVSESNNTSTLSYSLEIYRSGNISSSASKSYSIVFNNSTVASGSTTIGGSGTKIIKSGSVTIPHNSDGSKTFSYSFSQEVGITWSGSYIGTVTGSGSGVLDNIPRTSKHTLNVSSQLLGSSITISTNRASSSFTHTITYSFNGLSGTIGTGVTTSATFTLPANLADKMQNSTSSNGSIKCVTFSGSTKIGEHSVNFTARVPDNATYNPTIGGLSVSENNSLVTIGAYVQNVSRLNLSMTGVVARYSATIQSYKITFNGGTWNTSSAVTGAIKNSGTLPAVATIVDSRGRTATITVNVAVLAYSPPSISVLNVARANSDGTVNQVGTSILVTRTASSSSLVVSTERNNLKYTIKTRVKGATTWTTKVALTTHGSLSLTGTNVLSTYDILTSHDVLVEVSDLYNTTTAMATVASGQVTMSWSRNGIGVGKVWEFGALDVEGDVYVNNGFINLSNIIMSKNTDGSMRVQNGNGYVDLGAKSVTNELNIWTDKAKFDFNKPIDPPSIVNEDRIFASLVNGWSNYSTTDTGFARACYWKDKNGVVHLSGLITGGTTTSGTTLFTLPVGYRPYAKEMFITYSDGVRANTQSPRIDVANNGLVTGMYGLNATWTSLDGISFKAGN